MSELERSRSYVLWLLGRREYSRPQLEKKLKARGLQPEWITKLLDELREEGLFRETAYQKARTRQLLKKGLGASLVKAKLRFEKCEIKDGDIQEAFEAIGTTPQEELRKVVDKALRKYARGKELPPKELRQKILKSLMTKGHNVAAVLKSLDEALAELKAPTREE